MTTYQDWPKKTFGQALADTSQAYPNNLAIVFGDVKETYRELDQKVNTFAYGLYQLGIRRGDHVAVWMINRPEWIYAMYGVARLGGVVVPINTRYRTHELEYIFKTSDCKALFMLDSFLNIDLISLLTELCPEFGKQDPRHWKIPQFPVLETAICLGKTSYSGLLDYNTVMEMGENWRNSPEFLAATQQADPDDMVFIQFTSGTTSFPKGAMLTHDGILRDAFYVGKNMQLSSKDRYHTPMPFYHCGGSTLSVSASVVYGACMVIQEFWETEKAMQLLSKYQCTVTAGIDVILKMMYNHPDFAKYDLSSLRTGWTGGISTNIKEARQRLDYRPVNTYGLTEGSPNVSCTRVDDEEEVATKTMGKPHPGIEVKICDPDTGAILPPLKMGEICFRGWNAMKGYYKQPELNAKTIDKDNWVHPADLGMIDEQGRLIFLDKLKDMLKPGGENVAAAEVESFLCGNPKINLAEVVGVPDDRMGEAVCAFVQLRPGETATTQEVIEYCKGKLANFKVPKYVMFVNEFPRSANNKAQKYKLREQAVKELGLG